MQIRKYIGVTCVTLFALHCSSNSDSQLNSTKSTTPFIVIMGGNASCGDDLTPANMGMVMKVKDIVAQIEMSTGVKTPFLTTCYNSGGSKIFAMSSETGDEVYETMR